MAKQGYYIISADQYNILNTLGYGNSVTQIGGYYCVTDWYSIYDAIIAGYDATYDDDNPDNDEPESSYLTMQADVHYMYYSTEAHTWFPAE